MHFLCLTGIDLVGSLYKLLQGHSSDSVLDRYGNDFDSNVPLRHKSIRLGAVIILGMIEKAFFLAEYSTMNNSGRSVEGVLEVSLIPRFTLSCFAMHILKLREPVFACSILIIAC